ncbi:cell separation during budding [Kickxella alabastrina]|uniref:Cell separation during budding n=1 Tax=Kickxella alabastrina TaxID=61397 RepID=A0ACC1IPB0_9FUNG|nr:cell separation during budding [Kickxella alabastrina]
MDTDKQFNPVSSHPGLGATRHWLTVQAHELVENQQVIQVDSEASIEEACDTLIKHSIQSVPLYDSQSQTYVGMFDLHDLASYILSKRASSSISTPSPPPSSKGHHRQPSSPLVMRSETSSPMFRAVARKNSVGERVGRVSDMSHVNPFYSVLPETTVAQIASVFAKGTHRVAVMESERTIRGILSQTRIVRYFFEHCVPQHTPNHTDAAPMISESEDRLLDRSLRSLGLVTRDVIVAKPTTPVIQALSLLEQNHVSSLALVNDAGCILGNLSIADVKYLARDKALVNATCMELVQAVRFIQGMHDGKDRAAVFSVRPEATLRYALSKLVATGAHRVWITEPGSVNHSAVNLPLANMEATAPESALDALPARPKGRRASVSSGSSQTVPIAPPHYAGAFDDTVCGLVSLTDIVRLLIENAPAPAADPEYNYASMD